ncbi:MAG TPA: PAS domain S-box protein [Roseiflexaceae bacterium]|nr:PAS domain S-box protein [Roseiflexaceae bacterium]
MLEPQLPVDEVSRLAALYALDLLDTPVEERFEAIIRVATRLFDMPIVLISLVDANRQWFKSCQGLSISETPRSISFSAHAILQEDALVIPDAWQDPRFADNPLVTNAPHIRFYAGQPICTPDGSRVGTLCLMDRRPREFGMSDREVLRDLACWVERELQTVQLAEAQRLLEQTESHLRSLVAALSEGIVLQDRNGTIQACNASAERVLGLSADQLMGRTSIDPGWQAIHEDGTPFPGDQHPAMVTLRTGEPCVNIVMGVHKPNGELTWLLVNSQPMFLEGPEQPSAVVCSFADITERKQAEAARSAAEQRFRTLVEQLPAITYVAELDEDSSTLYTSPQIETMLGFTQDEWMADHSLWRKQIHPDDYDRVMEDMRLAQATGTPLPSEYRMLTRDGRPIWFRDQSQVVHDPAGTPLYLQGIMFDITERKLAEAALCASEARNRALLDAIPDLMFRLNHAGVYLDMRADRPSDLAAPIDKILGRTVFDMLPPHVAQQVIACIERALRTHTVQVIEYQLILEQMPRDFEARVVTCGENEVLAIVRDITERKNVERLKNEFVATVSHELRTPLTSIRGSLGLIAGGVAGEMPTKARSMVDIAYKNSERLIRLINDILDIEKIESGNMVFSFQPVELAPLLQSTIEANRAYGQQFDVSFDLELAAAGAWVYADSDRLVQALTNLLSNAAKFSRPGSRVLMTQERHGELIRIAIHDRGPGIPEAFRAQLFQKFAQADASNSRQKGGTGLGLSITKAIIDRLGGHIHLTTELGIGSTFFIDLPAWNVMEQPVDTPATHILACEPANELADLPWSRGPGGA